MKYPKTYHLPYSPGVTSDDKIQKDLSYYDDHEFIITEKMDGENTSMTHKNIWARSLDSTSHPSRSYVSRLWGEIAYRIPSNYQICGENLFAKHSIHYKNLESYFLVFSIWEKDKCLDWIQTQNLCRELGLSTVKVFHHESKVSLKDFKFDKFIEKSKINFEEVEGFVIRPTNLFKKSDFSRAVLKYVRKNHVQTDEHWLKKPLEKNLLKNP